MVCLKHVLLVPLFLLKLADGQIAAATIISYRHEESKDPAEAEASFEADRPVPVPASNRSFGDSNEDEYDEDRLERGLIRGGSPAASPQWFVHGGVCGGSLVWKDFFLTAAHCSWRRHRTVFIGSNNFLEVTPGAERNMVRKMIRHPSYTNESYLNDLMLVQLTAAVDENRPLARYNSATSIPADGAILTVTGFGLTVPGGAPASKLQSLKVTKVSDRTCANAFPELVGRGIFDQKAIVCATGGQKRGLCHGDSGGPLFDSAGTVVGIVSRISGVKCSSGYRPDLYARVSHAAKWIRETICTNTAFPDDLPNCSKKCLPPKKLCPNGACLAKNRCCSTEKSCADGTCVAKTRCCPRDKVCGDGTCVAPTSCCPGEKSCNGSCILDGACCADPASGCCLETHDSCNGACIPKGTCCVDPATGCCTTTEVECNGVCVSKGECCKKDNEVCCSDGNAYPAATGCPCGLPNGQYCAPPKKCCRDENGQGSCLDVSGCCPREKSCSDGTCVDSSACCPGQKPCNGECIPEGQCCPNEVCAVGGSCCPAGYKCCSETRLCIRETGCCPNERCTDGGSCCPAEEETCYENTVSGGRVCAKEHYCYIGGSWCGAGYKCCAENHQCIRDWACCPNEACTNGGSCCPAEEDTCYENTVSGGRVCAKEHYCYIGGSWCAEGYVCCGNSCARECS